jgi:rfaE bifunctional protein kinase chain/domain
MNVTKYAIRRERFQEIVGRIAEKKILIVGDVGVDRYTMGAASRLSQEAPVPIVAVNSVRDKLGMAANVAENVKSFGAIPYLTTLIGEDRIGEELCSLLKESAISTAHIYRHASRRTSLKERVIAQNQQIVRIDHERAEPLSTEAENFFCEKLPELVAKYDCVLFEDYAKGLLTSKVARTIIELAKKEKKFVSVDPPTMGRPLDAYREASLIKPNVYEAEKLSGIEITDEDSLEKAGQFLIQALDTPIVVITRGKQGMTLFTRNDRPIHVPTFARAVYDVSGAGDTVIAMLTLALISGASLEESAILANFAAGVEVGKQGTATVTIDELEQYMQLVGGLR